MFQGKYYARYQLKEIAILEKRLGNSLVRSQEAAFAQQH